MPAWAWAGIAAFYTLCALFVLGLCRADWEDEGDS